MENLIEELTKVKPSNLSEEGLKLFNKINEIIDRNEELEEKQKSYNTAYNRGKAFEDHKWVSLIKEKIEELKNKSKYCSSDELREYSLQIQVLEELLTPLKNV